MNLKQTTASAVKALQTFLRVHWKISAICMLAAIRVFFYSAAFPFFNNVDEAAHFDLIVKYSDLEIPDSICTFSEESAALYANYASWEYSVKAEKNYAPIKVSEADTSQLNFYNQVKSRVKQTINHEFSQAPLYYFLCAIWKKIGELFGLHGIELLYWIRFLNCLFIVLLVYFAYRIARFVFYDNPFLYYGTALLTSVIPQDTYYSIQNDVLSPLCFALSLLMVLMYIKTENPTVSRSCLTGLSLAAIVLAKSTNLPLFLLLFAFIVIHLTRKIIQKKGQYLLRSFGIIFLFCCLPLLLWMSWNVFSFGDLSGSQLKIQVLGWKLKPMSEWTNHPIFSLPGLLLFWNNLIASFWRGELIWENQTLRSPLADAFFSITSFLFLIISFIINFKNNNPLQNKTNALATLSFVLMILFMFLLSILFDFGTCANPSREKPYFISGRLITAALVPFVLIYLQALFFLLYPIRTLNLKYSILAVLLIAICISEFTINKQVLVSNFNWFHR